MMKRRDFFRGMMVLGGCAACARLGFASEEAAAPHWEYRGEHGPDHWGQLDKANLVCSNGTQQSPINISGAVRAEVEPLAVMWKKSGAKMVNNGHTIQVNMPPGNTFSRKQKTYELLQFHFHAPSEHQVDGMTYPMEMHFVHKHAESGSLAVIGVFLMPGMPHDAFSTLSRSFREEVGKETVVDKFSPSDLLPANLQYWTYEGSLTTPPCSEIVTWMVARDPLHVDAGDIQHFTSIYPGNARPSLPTNRRLILTSG
jgi:carbonic anhydrase